MTTEDIKIGLTKNAKLKAGATTIVATGDELHKNDLLQILV